MKKLNFFINLFLKNLKRKKLFIYLLILNLFCTGFHSNSFALQRIFSRLPRTIPRTVPQPIPGRVPLPEKSPNSASSSNASSSNPSSEVQTQSEMEHLPLPEPGSLENSSTIPNPTPPQRETRGVLGSLSNLFNLRSAVHSPVPSTPSRLRTPDLEKLGRPSLHASAVGDDREEKTTKPAGRPSTTPALLAVLKALEGYKPSEAVQIDPTSMSRIHETYDNLQLENPKEEGPIPKGAVAYATAAQMIHTKGTHPDRAFKNVTKTSAGESYPDELHSSITNAIGVKAAEEIITKQLIAAALCLKEESVLTDLSMRELRPLFDRAGLKKTAGSGVIKQGTIIEGSLEYADEGIGNYFSDCETNPIFDQLRYLASQLKQDASKTKQEKMDILYTYNINFLMKPDYTCKALRSMQKITRGEIKTTPLSHWAKSGTGDCRPHSMILACGAHLAGIDATYSNFFFEHGNPKEKLTRENHSVVTWVNETGEIIISDSFINQLNGLKLKDLLEGIDLPNGYYAKIDRALPFPEVYNTSKDTTNPCPDSPSTGESQHLPHHAVQSAHRESEKNPETHGHSSRTSAPHPTKDHSTTGLSAK